MLMTLVTLEWQIIKFILTLKRKTLGAERITVYTYLVKNSVY